jgi:hypothetical protein
MAEKLKPAFKVEFPSNLTKVELAKLNSKRLLNILQRKGITGSCIVGNNGTCITHGQAIKDCE